ncbi:MAG TPA: polyprenyl synthetase family protein [Thermoanaerobaculia bacterium]|nr:polyprenyl synthetase family protein [Thermoanaerobaculia bacterium]
MEAVGSRLLLRIGDRQGVTVPELISVRRGWIDDYLAQLASSTGAPEVLRRPVERALRSQGKRVRGILTLAAGEAAGATAERLVAAAAAFEMIHTCSLILDDLPSMDDAALRRGEPTLHLVFGENLAILSAVALLNHSYGLITSSHQALAPKRWPMAAVIQKVIDAVGWDGTIGGEAVDLHSDPSSLDLKTLEFIHSRKTGMLFVAAAAVGGMLANAAPSVVDKLEAYAKNLGLAFQITDDILDEIGTMEQAGKDVRQDAGRLTFVKLAGVEGARSIARELIDTATLAIGSLGKGAEQLRELAVTVRDRV